MELLGRTWVPLCKKSDSDKDGKGDDASSGFLGTTSSLDTTTASACTIRSAASSSSTVSRATTSSVSGTLFKNVADVWFFAETCARGTMQPYTISDILHYMTGGNSLEVDRLRKAKTLDKRIQKICMSTAVPTVGIPANNIKQIDDLFSRSGSC
ncbi:unnamed protein product, partial [Amoebophrya sp. A120]|eukprot:GSA120T00018850001.1